MEHKEPGRSVRPGDDGGGGGGDAPPGAYDYQAESDAPPGAYDYQVESDDGGDEDFGQGGMYGDHRPLGVSSKYSSYEVEGAGVVDEYGVRVTESGAGHGEEEKRLPIDWGHAIYAEEFENVAHTSGIGKKMHMLAAAKKRMDKKIREIAKLIVDESFAEWTGKGEMVPLEKRVLPPVNAGGTAGGTKFIADGILFKLATDPRIGRKYLYGKSKPSLDRAAKSAAQELKGTNAFYSYFLDEDIPVQVPLQTIVDYRGFRIVAMPVLPIQDSKLIYGSADGGRNVYNSDKKLDEWMCRAGKHLHLAQHRVGDVILSTGGDVEGHLVHSKSDGAPKYYLLDLARWAPPESAQDTFHLPRVTSSVFYRMLRPEFLTKQCKKEKLNIPPLSSDTFSGWGTDQKKEHKEHLRDATQKLCEVMIDGAVDQIVNVAEAFDIYQVPQTMFDPKALKWPDTFDLAGLMHQHGIPLRHLKLIWSHPKLTDPLLLSRAHAEALSRTVKHLLRKTLRLHDTDDLKSGLSRFLNLFWDSSQDADTFWKETIPLECFRSFGMVRFQLTKSEWFQLSKESNRIHAILDRFPNSPKQMLKGLFLESTGIKRLAELYARASEKGHKDPPTAWFRGCLNVATHVSKEYKAALNFRKRLLGVEFKGRYFRSKIFFVPTGLRKQIFDHLSSDDCSSRVPKILSLLIERKSTNSIIFQKKQWVVEAKRETGKDWEKLFKERKAVYDVKRASYLKNHAFLRCFQAYLARFAPNGKFSIPRLFVGEVEKWFGGKPRSRSPVGRGREKISPESSTKRGTRPLSSRSSTTKHQSMTRNSSTQRPPVSARSSPSNRPGNRDQNRNSKEVGLKLIARRHFLLVMETALTATGIRLRDSTWDKLLVWYWTDKSSHVGVEDCAELKLEPRLKQMNIVEWAKVEVAINHVATSTNVASFSLDTWEKSYNMVISEGWLRMGEASMLRLLRSGGADIHGRQLADLLCLYNDMHSQPPWRNVKSANSLRALLRLLRATSHLQSNLESSGLGARLPSLKQFLNQIVCSLGKLQKSFTLLHAQLRALPDSFGQLHALIHIDLSFNNFKEIPGPLFEMRMLQKLILFNNFIETIPPRIENLQCLEVLGFSHNKLTSLPEKICSLANLRILVCRDNKISALPAAIGELQKLEVLSISKNKLDSLPSSLWNLKKLKILNLVGLRLRKLPKPLSKLEVNGVQLNANIIEANAFTW